MSTTQDLSNALGTAGMDKPATEGGPGFVMSSAKWLKLQTFFSTVDKLPTTLAALKTQMGPGAPADMTDFQGLVLEYEKMQQGSQTFASLYPQIVKLAGHVADYGGSVGTYYPGLEMEIKALKDSPGDSTVQANIQALIKQLIATVQGYSQKASDVQNDIKKLAQVVQGYPTALTGPGGLYDYYNNKYGATSAELQALTSQVNDDTAALQDAEAAYNHAVIVASTTPTYGWIWPFGTIAAAAVAGVYGAKAVTEKNEIHALQSIIQELNEEKQAYANLMQSLISVKFHLSTLSDSADAALAIVQGIEGSWSTIGSQLTNISTALSKDFNTGLSFIDQLNYDQLVKDWTKLSDAATKFQTNAYITVAS